MCFSLLTFKLTLTLKVTWGENGRQDVSSWKMSPSTVDVHVVIKQYVRRVFHKISCCDIDSLLQYACGVLCGLGLLAPTRHWYFNAMQKLELWTKLIKKFVAEGDINILYCVRFYYLYVCTERCQTWLCPIFYAQLQAELRSWVRLICEIARKLAGCTVNVSRKKFSIAWLFHAVYYSI